MENREKASGEIYIYPEVARKKLKTAQALSQTVYLYGSIGYGKTALIRQYLGRRRYAYFDAATVKAEELERAENARDRGQDGPGSRSEQPGILVIDNIQSAEPEEIREAIVRLTADKSRWVILAGKCRCPGWLMSAQLSGTPFMVIGFPVIMENW